jgi:FdhE protein
MSRTAAGLRIDTPTRLAELARQRPEWQTWTTLLQMVWRSVDDDRWSPPIVDPESTRSSSDGPAPLLHGRILRLDGGLAHRLVTQLASTALGGEPAGHSPVRLHLTESESLQLIKAAICEQAGAIRALAADRSVDAGALGSVAQMAALPALQACGRQLQSRLPVHWAMGYCPICAAWPVLAERRGLDRSRRLRCGRCAADWEVEWLYCIYCGERDHRQLGSLAPDEAGDRLKVETCGSCKGYLKSVASLQGLSPLELLLQDLDTVELDLVALDRGYRRPHPGGFSLNLSVVQHAARSNL